MKDINFLCGVAIGACIGVIIGSKSRNVQRAVDVSEKHIAEACEDIKDVMTKKEPKTPKKVAKVTKA